MNELLSLNIKAALAAFKKEHFAFWMIFCYLLVEYVRPQMIVPALDFLPWGQLFILGALVGVFVDPHKQMAKDQATFWIVALLVVILISANIAYFPTWSFNHLDYYYTWVVIYFLIASIVTTEKRFFLFLMLFFLASFKLSAFGAKTWALRGFAFTDWGLLGPPGFFENSGEYAIQMAVFFGMSYPFYAYVKNRLPGYKKWILLLFPVTAAMSVMGASSRGSQLALIVQCYFLFLHGKVSIRTIVLGGAVFAAIYYMIPEEQLARFESAGSDKTSQQRLLYWEHGLDMLLDHPVMGVGFWNFPPYYEQHYRADMLYDTAQLPHNIFVQVASELGFLGLFIYLMMIWRAFSLTRVVRKMERNRLGKENSGESWITPVSKGMDIGFLGFLIAGQFVSVVYYPFMWIHLAMCVGLKSVAAKLQSDSSDISKPSKRIVGARSKVKR